MAPAPRSAISILPLSVPIHATVLISTGRAGASIDQPSSRATTAWGRLLGGGGTGLSQPTGHASLSGRGRDRWAIRRSKPENLTWNDERGHEPLRFPVVIGIQRPTDGSSEEQAGAMTGRRASRISLPVSRSITGCAGGRSRTIGFPRAFRDGKGGICRTIRPSYVEPYLRAELHLHPVISPLRLLERRIRCGSPYQSFIGCQPERPSHWTDASCSADGS